MPTTAAATTKPRAFLPIILQSSLRLRGHPWDHHGPTEGAGVYTTPGTLTNRGATPPPRPNSFPWIPARQVIRLDARDPPGIHQLTSTRPTVNNNRSGRFTGPSGPGCFT